MRIRLIGDRRVAPDGLHIATWLDGSEHELEDVHALSMIEAGHAVAADLGPSERKVVEPDEPGQPKRKRS